MGARSGRPRRPSSMQNERFGNYEIISKIGQGAMGEVFRARDTVLSRDVAVKTILADMGGDDTLRRRFQREAQSAAGLNHPNIITVYDFGQEHERLYMAMELLEGQDLKHVIAERQLATLDAKLEVMEQVAEGLAFAHQNEVIHRDLKPANIHLQPGGQVKIVDFGLARLSGSDMTRAGMIMGTPHYMSPEQVRGERVDTRSDVFSVGCIFYEVLTARKPFDSDSMHAVLFKVLQEDPTPVRQILADLPVVVEQVLERCLAKDPHERFHDAGALLEALREAREALAAGRGHAPLAGLPVPPSPAARKPTSPPSSSGARPASRSQPPRAGATLPPIPEGTGTRALLVTGLALAAILAGVVLAWVLLRRGMPAATPSPTGQVDSLARAVAVTQAELARKKFDVGDYDEAARQAERALGFDPGNAEARDLRQRARAVLAQRDKAEREARAAAASGDAGRAADALWELMRANPEAALIAELAPTREAAFEARADEARRTMASARADADNAGLAGVDAFKAGERLARDGDASARARRWATAAASFLAARERFVRTLPSKPR